MKKERMRSRKTNEKKQEVRKSLILDIFSRCSKLKLARDIFQTILRSMRRNARSDYSAEKIEVIDFLT